MEENKINYEININKLDPDTTFLILKKYRQDLLEKLKTKNNLNNDEEVKKFLYDKQKQYSEGKLKLGITVSNIEPQDFSKIYLNSDLKTKQDILNKVKDRRIITNLLREEYQNNIDKQTIKDKIESGIGNVLSFIGSAIEKYDPKFKGLEKERSELSDIIEKYSGADLIKKGAGKLYDILPDIIAKPDKQRKEIFEQTVSSFYPPKLVSDYIRNPSLLNTILTITTAKPITASFLATTKLPIYKTGGISLADLTGKTLEKTGQTITQGLTHNIEKNLLPQTSFKSFVQKMETTQPLYENTEKAFKISEFLTKKGFKPSEQTIRKIMKQDTVEIPQNIINLIKEGDLTTKDVKKIYKIADKSIDFDLEHTNTIKKMFKQENPRMIEGSKRFNKLFEQYKNKYIAKQLKDKNYTIKSNINEIQQLVDKKKINEIFNTRPVNYKQFKTPRQAIETLDIKTILTSRKPQELQNINNIRYKLYSDIDSLVRTIFDQNIDLIKNKAYDLYKFYNDTGRIYYSAYEKILPITEKIRENLIKDKYLYNYANSYIYLNSLLEEIDLGNSFGFKIGGQADFLPRDTIIKKLKQLDEEYLKLKYGKDFNKHFDELQQIKTEIDDLSKKMSDTGLEILKNMPFVDKAHYEAIVNANRKYYFSYLPEKEVDKLLKLKKGDWFGETKQVVENLFTPFLKERGTNAFIPNFDVFGSFIKGVITKQYALEKFNVIRQTIDTLGLTEDELLNGITNPIKIKNVAEISGLNEEILKKGKITSPERIGYKEITVPFINEENKLIAKKVYLPIGVVDFVDDKVNTFSKTILEEMYDKVSFMLSKGQISLMLETNPVYLFKNMIHRDILNSLLYSPGALTKTSKKIALLLNKHLNVEITDPTKILRPFIDLDSIKAALKVAVNNKDAEIMLGKTGAFAHKPSVDKMLGIGDLIKISEQEKSSVLSRTKNIILNGLYITAGNFMETWEKFIKSWQFFRQVPQEININELLKTKEGISKLENYINKTQSELLEYFVKNYSTIPSSAIKGVSIDFNKVGSFTVKLKSFTYFLNPQLQDIRNVYLFAKSQPKAFALRYASAQAALSALNLMLFEWDKQNQEKYGSKYIPVYFLSSYRLGKYANIPLGIAELTDGTKVPILFGITLPESLAYSNMIFSNNIAFEYLINNIKRDYANKEFDKSSKEYNIINEIKKNRIYDAEEMLFSITLGLVPSIAYSFITGKTPDGREVIPPSIKELSPGSQYTDTTSNIFRYLGNILNIPPRALQEISNKFPIIRDIPYSQTMQTYFGNKLLKKQIETGNYPTPIIYETQPRYKDEIFNYLLVKQFFSIPNKTGITSYTYDLIKQKQQADEQYKSQIYNIKKLFDNLLELEKSNIKITSPQVYNNYKYEISNAIKQSIITAVNSGNIYLDSINNYANNKFDINNVDFNVLKQLFQTTDVEKIKMYSNQIKMLIDFEMSTHQYKNSLNPQQ